MLTEAQAKTRKCQETFNSQNTADNCIASYCMAWRWAHFVARHAKKGTADIGDSGPATGYCGKAGKP